MAFSAAADHRLAHLVHLDRGLHAGLDAELLKRVLHRERVHHGGEHAHVIGLRTVHPLRRARHAAEDIAATDHEADFEARFLGRLHFLGEFGNEHRIDPELLIPHQHFAREFQEHALDRGKAHGNAGLRARIAGAHLTGNPPMRKG